MSLSDHGQKALREASAMKTSSSNGNFAKENIWFDWNGKDEHVVRIVGDFVAIRTHWIGESKFGQDVEILKPSAFKGENKLPMTVACGNWQVADETEDPEGNACPVCRLWRNADAMLKKHGKEMEESDKEAIKSIRRKCAVKCQYLFKVIDRENPYVDEEKTKKGYKILRAPEKLLKAIIELSSKMKGIGISSPDEGIDVVIKKQTSESNRNDITYSVLPVMDGISVKQTPLTEEENAFNDIDLHKFSGKAVDFSRFEEELSDTSIARVVYESSDNEDGNAPF